jgi:hypothetical protein
VIEDWEEYYELRNLPPTSKAALLMTFPLTVFHGLRKFCGAQLYVARASKRKVLKVHLVGCEKELMFLDMFHELFVLFERSGVSLELTFVVRADMLPPNCKEMSYSVANNVVNVVSGSYGDTLSPDFDVPGGKPDVIFALNAGLFAYESWSSVTDYIAVSGVTAVFTDYNEYSGLNSASVGGGACRDSLCVNEFRQPLALPVFSMNLPQFSNGFFYVFNEVDFDV